VHYARNTCRSINLKINCPFFNELIHRNGGKKAMRNTFILNLLLCRAVKFAKLSFSIQGSQGFRVFGFHLTLAIPDEHHI